MIECLKFRRFIPHRRLEVADRRWSLGLATVRNFQGSNSNALKSAKTHEIPA